MNQPAPESDQALIGDVLELRGGTWRVVLLGNRFQVRDERRIEPESWMLRSNLIYEPDWRRQMRTDRKPDHVKTYKPGQGWS